MQTIGWDSVLHMQGRKHGTQDEGIRRGIWKNLLLMCILRLVSNEYVVNAGPRQTQAALNSWSSCPKLLRYTPFLCLYVLRFRVGRVAHAYDANVLEKEAEESQVLGQSETHHELLATLIYSKNWKNGSFLA